MKYNTKKGYRKEFPEGMFNPYIEMEYYFGDITPNNMQNGAPQLTRGRIDHVNSESEKARKRVEARWNKSKSSNQH